VRRNLFRRRTLWDWLGTDQAVFVGAIACGAAGIVLAVIFTDGLTAKLDAAQKSRHDSHTASGTVDCRSNK